MSVERLKEEILRLLREVAFFEKFEVIDETPNTLKGKLTVSDLCYVQIYVNFKKRLKNYVVVLSGQRVYGRDCDGGRWHKHPWENPSEHEKAKEVTLKEFLFEVFEGLRTKGIL